MTHEVNLTEVIINVVATVLGYFFGHRHGRGKNGSSRSSTKGS